jgi:hypothetical protein
MATATIKRKGATAKPPLPSPSSPAAPVIPNEVRNLVFFVPSLLEFKVGTYNVIIWFGEKWE